MFWRFTLGVNSMGFDKCLNDMYPQNTSTVLNPSVLYLFVSPPLPCKPRATSDLASLCSFAFPKTSYSWNHIHSLCPLCSIERSIFFLMVHSVPYLFWHKFLVVIYTVNLFLCISWLLLCSKPPQNVVAYKHHHVDDTRDWLFGLGLAGEVCLCSM